MTNLIVEPVAVAKILADKDIRKLLGTVILNADAQRINPNGIEIRLGKHVLFQSTDEEKELTTGTFLKVLPGESVTISSYEQFDFRKETIGKSFPGCNIMAMITPTTTMMREGIMQSSTKVDSGWAGTLNWGLRNSSIRDFVLGYGEPIFKLTFFLLEGDEIPDVEYGDSANPAIKIPMESPDPHERSRLPSRRRTSLARQVRSSIRRSNFVRPDTRLVISAKS